MPNDNIWDPTRPPREGWLWVPGVGWVQLPPPAAVPIPPQQFVETHLRVGSGDFGAYRIPVVDEIMEGVNMFGMKLWTILLIAAAIAYFMNK